MVCLFVGLIIGTVHGNLLLRDLLPEPLEGQDLSLRGTIEGLPQYRPHRGGTWRFDFRVDHCSETGCVVKRVRLSFRTNALLREGQAWNLQVRLKRPRSYANPGSFDYARWLVSSGLHASGYVRSGTLVAEGSAPRARVVEYLRERLQPYGRHPLLLALAVGDRDRLSEGDWEILRESGLSHLVAISGLHIGIAAGMGLLLGRLLSQIYGRSWLAMACGLGAATGYAWLAGFSLPTQRALIMVSAGLLALFLGRGVNRWQVMSLALLLVLLLQPMASLTPGFWLSFGAVAVLLAVFDRTKSWLSLFRAQWSLLLGLAPLSLAFFSLLSPLSLPVNLIAVPIFSVVLIPLTLVALCLEGVQPALAEGLWWLANIGLHAVMTKVEWLVPRLPAWQYTPDTHAWSGICLAFALLLAPNVLPARYLFILFLTPLAGALMLAVQSPELDRGSLKVDVLDVGQGLSVVIRTRSHSLVYDVGARYSDSFDLADAVVLPFLAHERISRLDKLIVSHNDNDHAGAYSKVVQAYPDVKLLSGELLSDSEPCRAGESWQWDRVRFQWLHPRQARLESSSNNRSCVLLIQSGSASILLPGDIDRSVEQRLQADLARAVNPPLSVLIAPHHGSKTSSSSSFIGLLQPHLVVFSAGYKHQFGHPAPEVVERYKNAGSGVASTAASGAISILLSPRGVEGVTRHREQRRFYWQ